MGDLARRLIQEGVLSPEAASRALKSARNGDIASAALELRLADEGALVRALSTFHECVGVDLSRSVVPVSHLSVVTPDFCLDRQLVPVTVSRFEIVLAMANPEDLPSADEVRFLSGRRVQRAVAVGTSVLRALEGLARARREGAPAWRGERAPVLADPGEAFASIVKPAATLDVPDAPESMEVIGLADIIDQFQSPAPVDAGRRPAPTAAGERHGTLKLEGLAVGKVALVADDDRAVRQLVATVLTNMGCVVMQAADGKAALELARDARPDLVVLDAMMPGMHGFEVCRAIKADRHLRSTRVILCSAIYRGTVGADAQAAFGADGFVEKPFRLEELTRIVKVALVGPAAAETSAEKAAREEAQALWGSAAEALAAGRLAQAADLARDAANKDPWSAEAHYYLGHALSKQGLLLEAVAAYERAAELRPDVDATHQCLGQTYERLGFQKSAREAWSRALETCKDPARKKVMQARLLKLLGG